MTAQTAQSIPINRIAPNRYQKRDVTRESVADLIESILEHGLQSKPVGREHPDRPGWIELASGHRRHLAFVVLAEADPKTYGQIEIDVRPLSDRALYDACVIENAQREDLSPLEKADLLADYMERFKVSQTEAGKLFNLKTQGAVSNLIKLRGLSAPIRPFVGQKGGLPERHARGLVALARSLPDQALAIAQRVVKADSDEKDGVFEDALRDVLQKHGQGLWHPPFDPRQQYALDGFTVEAAKAGLTELPVCHGCPFNLERNSSHYCIRPACYNLKAKVAVQDEIEKAVKKLGLPLAAKGESTTIVYDGSSDSHSDKQRADKLIRAKLPELRLVPNPKRETASYYLSDVFGTTHLALAATSKAVVERWLADNEGKSVKAPTAKPANETAAQKAKRIAREAEDDRQRRAERAQALQAKYDVLWLLENTAGVVAQRIRISGGVLKWVAEETDRRHSVAHTQWPEFGAIEDRIQKAGEAGSEDALRQHIVLDVLGEDVLGYRKSEEAYDWSRAQGLVEEVAEGEVFGVSLPDGWNKPPIHHTAFNCWTCGRFTPGPKITQRDTAEGWGVLKTGVVHCPDHAPKDVAKAQVVIKSAKLAKQQAVKKTATRARMGAGKPTRVRRNANGKARVAKKAAKKKVR